MGKFLETHRNLHNAEKIDRYGTKYTRLSITGKVIEQWTKNRETGEWEDTTKQAKIAEQIEETKKQLQRERMKQARKVLEETRAQESKESSVYKKTGAYNIVK